MVVGLQRIQDWCNVGELNEAVLAEHVVHHVVQGSRVGVVLRIGCAQV